MNYFSKWVSCVQHRARSFVGAAIISFFRLKEITVLQLRLFNSGVSMKNLKFVFVSLAMCFGFNLAHAEEVGSVDTAFKLLGANHKVVMEVFDDPAVAGVSCYISYAKKGGVSGAFGFAEDPSESSVACRQVGEISFKGPLAKQEEVFSQKASILFKKTRVIRAVDSKRNVLVYLVYSDKLLDGSPKNSITAVPVGKVIPIK
jgi:CreA protein